MALGKRLQNLLLLFLVIGVRLTLQVTLSKGEPGLDFLHPVKFKDPLGNKVDKFSNISYVHIKAKTNYRAGKNNLFDEITVPAWLYGISADLVRFAMGSSYPYGKLLLSISHFSMLNFISIKLR